MEVFRYRPGRVPLLVSMPHVGMHIPSSLAARMTPDALALPDTDWHVDRLYDFLDDLGAHVIAATHSRYVIDLNRDPESRPLYPGADNTELCPTTTFGRTPIYREGGAPADSEVAERRVRYWQPYHDQLAAVLEELRSAHGQVLLWDAHSIRSQVPRFFEGRLPDFNIGTGGGVTASPEMLTAIAESARDDDYSLAVDGRFKGGFITRRYGRPAEGQQAVQLELSWATYMDEDPPFAFREDLAARVRPRLKRVLQAGVQVLQGQ